MKSDHEWTEKELKGFGCLLLSALSVLFAFALGLVVWVWRMALGF